MSSRDYAIIFRTPRATGKYKEEDSRGLWDLYIYLYFDDVLVWCGSNGGSVIIYMIRHKQNESISFGLCYLFSHPERGWDMARPVLLHHVPGGINRE